MSVMSHQPVRQIGNCNGQSNSTQIIPPLLQLHQWCMCYIHGSDQKDLLGVCQCSSHGTPWIYVCYLASLNLRHVMVVIRESDGVRRWLPAPVPLLPFPCSTPMLILFHLCYFCTTLLSLVAGFQHCCQIQQCTSNGCQQHTQPSTQSSIIGLCQK